MSMIIRTLLNQVIELYPQVRKRVREVESVDDAPMFRRDKRSKTVDVVAVTPALPISWHNCIKIASVMHKRWQESHLLNFKVKISPVLACNIDADGKVDDYMSKATFNNVVAHLQGLVKARKLSTDFKEYSQALVWSKIQEYEYVCEDLRIVCGTSIVDLGSSEIKVELPIIARRQADVLRVVVTPEDGDDVKGKDKALLSLSTSYEEPREIAAGFFDKRNNFKTSIASIKNSISFYKHGHNGFQITCTSCKSGTTIEEAEESEEKYQIVLQFNKSKCRNHAYAISDRIYQCLNLLFGYSLVQSTCEFDRVAVGGIDDELKSVLDEINQ